jgi:hypothetical protein
MLRIYTGERYSHKLASIDATYCWPEEKRGGYEQLEWFDKHLEEFQTKDISIKTFSPYILNYLNLIIAEGKIVFNDIEVTGYFSINDDAEDEDEHYFSQDLKISESKLIDTRFAAEPISDIYEKYYKIKNNK